MKNENSADEGFDPTYRSGTAARLAGIPVETLRVWERRYGVVGPRLTPRGHRLYSPDDVSRLALIRQLVDLGNPISSLARQPLAALRELRASATAALRETSAGRMAERVRVAIVGSALAARLGREGALRPTLEIVASCADEDDAMEALRGLTAEVIAVELPTLQPESVATVDALLQAVGARHAVVAFRFAPAAVTGKLRDRGHTTVRSPLDADEFERICRDVVATDSIRAPSAAMAPQVLDAIPNRRFDDEALTRLSQALVTLNCECPHHVVELLLGLGGFERYSAECANRNPSDAVLHRYLQRVAGSARAMFEDALIRVARAEGLAVPAAARDATLTT